MHGIVTTLFNRAGLRACGLAVLVSIAAVFVPNSASALVEIDITQGNIEPLPIALPSFSWISRRYPQQFLLTHNYL